MNGAPKSAPGQEEFSPPMKWVRRMGFVFLLVVLCQWLDTIKVSVAFQVLVSSYNVIDGLSLLRTDGMFLTPLPFTNSPKRLLLSPAKTTLKE